MSHGEPSPSLSATALQHLAAVLSAHALEKSVGLLATTIIGLKRALPLCHLDCVLHELSVETSSRQTPNTSCRSTTLSKTKADQWRCVTVRGRRVRCSMFGGQCSPFGFSPKISTPVENTVEKQAKRQRSRWKCPFYRDFGEGEGRLPHVLRPSEPAS